MEPKDIKPKLDATKFGSKSPDAVRKAAEEQRYLKPQDVAVRLMPDTLRALDEFAASGMLIRSDGVKLTRADAIAALLVEWTGKWKSHRGEAPR